MISPFFFISTYFIEYVFPGAATSTQHDRSKRGNGEVTRAVASKVAGGGTTCQRNLCERVTRFLTAFGLSHMYSCVFFSGEVPPAVCVSSPPQHGNC